MTAPDFQPSWWGRPGSEHRCAEVRAAFSQSQLFLAMCELSRALDERPASVPGVASLVRAITSVSWLSHLADESTLGQETNVLRPWLPEHVDSRSTVRPISRRSATRSSTPH
jgi:hypothetical protein